MQTPLSAFARQYRDESSTTTPANTGRTVSKGCLHTAVKARGVDNPVTHREVRSVLSLPRNL